MQEGSKSTKRTSSHSISVQTCCGALTSCRLRLSTIYTHHHSYFSSGKYGQCTGCVTFDLVSNDKSRLRSLSSNASKSTSSSDFYTHWTLLTSLLSQTSSNLLLVVTFIARRLLLLAFIALIIRLFCSIILFSPLAFLRLSLLAFCCTLRLGGRLSRCALLLQSST